jgi:hypothetical protein
MKPARTKLLKSELELAQIPPEARKQAACVLEVLAGVRTPDQAAQSLSISLPTYYNLEMRALRGLIFSCTPQPPGRSLSLARKLRQAELKASAAEKQLQRYQALLRNVQRNAGLLAPPPPPKDLPRGKRRPRKPAVRAMRVIEALQPSHDGSSADPVVSPRAVDAPVAAAS